MNPSQELYDNFINKYNGPVVEGYPQLILIESDERISFVYYSTPDTIVHCCEFRLVEEEGGNYITSYLYGSDGALYCTLGPYHANTIELDVLLITVAELFGCYDFVKAVQRYCTDREMDAPISLCNHSSSGNLLDVLDTKDGQAFMDEYQISLVRATQDKPYDTLTFYNVSSEVSDTVDVISDGDLILLTTYGSSIAITDTPEVDFVYLLEIYQGIINTKVIEVMSCRESPIMTILHRDIIGCMIEDARNLKSDELSAAKRTYC